MLMDAPGDIARGIEGLLEYLVSNVLRCLAIPTGQLVAVVQMKAMLAEIDTFQR
jgi:hypothetical protein